MTTPTGGFETLLDVRVPLCPASPNRVKHWAVKGRVSRKIGNAIATELQLQGLWRKVHRLMLPYAEVHIERGYNRANLIWDVDNLHFAYKGVVDTLRAETPSEMAGIQKKLLTRDTKNLPVRMGIFIADDPDSVKVHYSQVYTKGMPYTRVIVCAPHSGQAGPAGADVCAQQ